MLMNLATNAANHKTEIKHQSFHLKVATFPFSRSSRAEVTYLPLITIVNKLKVINLDPQGFFTLTLLKGILDI